MTPKACFDQLLPTLQEVERLIRTAPLEPKARAGLALLVTTFFFTCAVIDMQATDAVPGEGVDETAQKTAEILLSLFVGSRTEASDA